MHLDHVLPCHVNEISQKIEDQIQHVISCVLVQLWDALFFSTCIDLKNKLPSLPLIQPILLLLVILPCCVLTKINYKRYHTKFDPDIIDYNGHVSNIESTFC